jgi:anti-sigma factor (TIGR02949 family)
MTCDEVRAQLGPYLDGELDRAAVDALESHLPGCAACRSELAALEQLRGALRALPRQRAPAELRRRLETLTEQRADIAPRAPRYRIWALAATLVLGTALGVLVMVFRDGGLGDAGRLLARDLVSSHLRALAASSPIDVVSEDRHTVKPWFSGKIGESPPVVDPKSEDYPLLGGRIDYVGEQRTAVIVYGHRKHIIDVYIVPGEPGREIVDSQGYSLVPCRLQGRAAWIVSDVDADAVTRFRDLIDCR